MLVPLLIPAVPSPASVFADAIGSVPTMEMGRRSRGDDGNNYQCDVVQADLCRVVHRPAAEPGAAADEMDKALRDACTMMNGDYDAAGDIALLRDVGLESVSQRDRARYSITHSCRTAVGLSGVKIAVVDYWTQYRSLPYRQQKSKLLGPRQDSFETLTTVIGYSPAALERRTVQQAEARRETCRRSEQFSLREGQQTMSGLVVEVRQSVVLVQPAVGAARWMPIADLKPVHATPC